MRASQPSRNGFTLLELLVVLTLVGVLLGLLVPAVQKARASAAQVTCQNHLRQIGLGFHNAADVNAGQLPPGIGWYPQPTMQAGNGYGNGLFHLLPYVEASGLYQGASNGFFYDTYLYTPGVCDRKVDLFLCPADFSAGSGVLEGPSGLWGAGSYAGNAQVFAKVDSQGNFLDPQGAARLNSTFTDGAANTILMAEKYSSCTNLVYLQGGVLWAYAYTGQGVEPLHPAFAISWRPSSIGTGSLFLTQPDPTDCDPTLASTSHPVMPVVMADGSVHALPPGISGEVWWALCTPAGNEVIELPW
jgi:prepilin-type N-terminal cleavage/methylation domain-containing protein